MAGGVYIFLGPPASGKGTQAKYVSEKLHLPHVAPGDILREAVRSGTPLGVQAKGYMDAGRLVPDDLVISMTLERFNREDCKSGYIVDGFPRTLKQAEALEGSIKEKKLQIAAVIYIKIQVEAAVARLAGRRSCKKCGAVYHVVFNPPKQALVCDKCGGELYQRHDDSEEVIKTRFSVYEKETLPLVEHYKKLAKLMEVSGEKSVDEVKSAIASLLKIRW